MIRLRISCSCRFTLALALANVFDEDSTPNPAVIADLADTLPTIVPLIAEYWRDAADEQNSEPAPRVRSALTVRHVRRRRTKTDGANAVAPLGEIATTAVSP
jgi:hypothetical protein